MLTSNPPRLELLSSVVEVAELEAGNSWGLEANITLLLYPGWNLLRVSVGCCWDIADDLALMEDTGAPGAPDVGGC